MSEDTFNNLVVIGVIVLCYFLFAGLLAFLFKRTYDQGYGAGLTDASLLCIDIIKEKFA